MQSASEVSKHFNTESFVKPASSTRHPNTILEKWRPYERPNNTHEMGRVSPLSWRDPVSFNEVNGGLPWAERRNHRSSKRGKDQMRPKILELETKLSNT